MRYTIYSSVILLLFSSQGFAQQFLTGKVYRKDSKEILFSVNIENRTQHRHDISDESGAYRIQAGVGDLLVFSSVGFRPDTLVISPPMLSSDYPVYMEPKVVTLQSVRVGSLSNYQIDSLERREEYSWVYDHGEEKRFARERKGDGVGISLNILRNASHADKDRESLKKRLLREEENYYVDFRYPREYVARLTHLKGDSLQHFMEHFKPSYDFCRKAANVDILVFINDSYKKFMRGEQ
jgi:hypothetical protein